GGAHGLDLRAAEDEERGARRTQRALDRGARHDGERCAGLHMDEALQRVCRLRVQRAAGLDVLRDLRGTRRNGRDAVVVATARGKGRDRDAGESENRTAGPNGHDVLARRWMVNVTVAAGTRSTRP